jgi:hypothetical protein
MWSGSAGLSNSTFQWCSPNGSAVTNTSVLWQKGQPDNLGGNQRCLHGRVLTNVSKIVVSDRNCSDKYVLACETKVTTPPPACDSPMCPSINYTRNVGPNCLQLLVPEKIYISHHWKNHCVHLSTTNYSLLQSENSRKKLIFVSIHRSLSLRILNDKRPRSLKSLHRVYDHYPIAYLSQMSDYIQWCDMVYVVYVFFDVIMS